ncbi:PQQ-dependent sugar dehydrogenase [Chroogloeocystis siderophila]|jgi:glucose/arabinose dehydrogenase|uniref:Glucose sorbosone dehydrogenase n=1 Tax=Chroogloeocystis siderophila 5.2 s.c.1 TaxID=247279 RepID=A0A1U7HHP9_9CHRO|nr:PQQ-dependent sugar dehydrogenase [Chroogloeocystis siderophila]OKH23116.1 glucose sorbosone dehydrogenase [Chroogloeocystis siderophila 5.2 s.c.1]
MQLTRIIASMIAGISTLGVAACGVQSTEQVSSSENVTQSPRSQLATANQQACTLVPQGAGPQGQVDVRVEEVATGLEVPWGIAFLPNNDMLVTERPGRVRLVRNGQLQPAPVATINVTDSGEGGLLGIAAHPNFAQNRLFYLYYTADRNGTPINRVERWQLSQDGTSATADRMIIDDIPVALYHNGGRIRFGPDGMLYIGTGDARKPDISQDVDSLAGKILRVTPDGEVPPDNPFPGNPVYISGIRNTQGFDWANDSTLWVTDHGPSGELGRSGHDKVSVASAGDNLGWPTIYRCETQEGLVTPSLVWRQAVPPGGAAVYTGNAIPEWQGSLMIATLRSEHLHRVVFEPNSQQVQQHEVYLQGEYGRLRDAVMGSDGELYITTSNCDGRGNCPAGQDKILRVTR